jgi:tRNA (Thr-GGU) A37 N-methylase
MSFEVKAIGSVESPLLDLKSASGDEIIVITWLDRARRDVLSVHPRGDTSRAPEGVFNTRSPHRPSPIGLHRVEITAINGQRVRVRNLETCDTASKPGRFGEGRGSASASFPRERRTRLSCAMTIAVPDP